MKKRQMSVWAIVWFWVICLLLLCGPSLAEESVKQVLNDYGDAKELVFTVTTAANGSVTDTAVSAEYMRRLRGLYLYAFEVNPGATAPSNGYDISLVDSHGLDACHAQANNRSDATTEDGLCAASSGPYYQVGASTLTLNVGNNLVDSANMTILWKFGK